MNRRDQPPLRTALRALEKQLARPVLDDTPVVANLTPAIEIGRDRATEQRHPQISGIERQAGYSLEHRVWTSVLEDPSVACQQQRGISAARDEDEDLRAEGKRLNPRRARAR